MTGKKAISVNIKEQYLIGKRIFPEFFDALKETRKKKISEKLVISFKDFVGLLKEEGYMTFPYRLLQKMRCIL